MKIYKKIHCIGIGGIHVSALAKLLLSHGAQVSGSDLVQSEITDELKKCNPNLRMHPNATNSTNAATMLSNVDLVIYSDAVPENDIERVAAKKLGIPQMSSYEFIGELSKDYYTIAISGTNGKSTTTAMLGLILEKAGLDPTVIVGTKVNEWGGNIRIGPKPELVDARSVQGKKYLVTEADEYKAHMLKLNTKMIVLTNIEEDHLDFYKDLDDIVEHFKKFVQKLPKNGVLIYNKDDDEIVKLLSYHIVRKVGYTIDDMSSLKLQIPGEFNLYNAAAAASAAKELGISDEVIKKSLENFKGTWRRFERVGKYKGALIISDYAHHPTAVAATIKATKELYPNRRLVAVFQPHQHNRTKKLFNDFLSALAKSEADIIIVSEIYDVAGRTSSDDKKVSSKNLVDAIKNSDSRRPRSREPRPSRRGAESSGSIKRQVSSVSYAKDLEETSNMIVQTIKPKDVALIMGAGTIDEVARGLVK